MLTTVRSGTLMGAYDVFRFEGFMLDRQHRHLNRGARLVELRPRSFDVLTCLVERAGRLVTKDELIEAVWPDVVVTDESLTRCICDVRRALEDSGQDIIKTLPRRGYLFAARIEQGPFETRPTETPAVLPAEPIELAVPFTTADERAVMENGRRMKRFRLGWSIGILILVTVLDGSALWLLRPAATLVAEYPSVAVLPFNNLSDDPALDHFVDGIIEDLAVDLSKFGTLSVIARSSAFRFKDAAVDARHIGQDLGADYLLQGSVRRDPQRLRIVVQLVETDSGRQLWAERYDSEPDGILAVQDELTQRIVTTLAARIDQAEIEHARQLPETRLDALLARSAGQCSGGFGPGGAS